jgi:hypothetical protein
MRPGSRLFRQREDLAVMAGRPRRWSWSQAANRSADPDGTASKQEPSGIRRDRAFMAAGDNLAAVKSEQIRGTV